MKTQTGLTIETKGNRINVYTSEEVKRREEEMDRIDTIISTIKAGVIIASIVLFYAWVFTNFNA